jgi:ppGpp synthetase/RelA/SpoT-type nucleotidyltranferase
MSESFELAMNDVDRFLLRNRPDYERFLDIVFREISEYRDLRRNSSPIYRIYTRADKQTGGEKLKSTLGIALKLAKWRDENKNRERIQVSKIHDIIGVTVVTYFESDVARVVNALKRARFRSFSVVSDDPILRPDYNANHVIVKQNGRGLAYGGLLCEIQIKSLLHDGWSTRTHDLYKDKSKGAKIDKRIAALTRLVKLLEEESDALRDELEYHNVEDNMRRDAAAISLFSQLIVTTKNSVSDMSALVRKLIDNRDYLSDCATDDSALLQILDQWQRTREETQDNLTACRFMAMLALLRSSRDFDNEALNAIDIWVDGAPSDVERAQAYSLRALANWALGYVPEAVDAARQLLALAEKQGLKVATAKWNLAYYLAEDAYNQKQPGLHASELKRLVDEECGAENERQTMSFRDSLGAIKIMTANSRAQVFEGQRLCETAQKWAATSVDDERVFQLFYELHESRAVRLLQTL